MKILKPGRDQRGWSTTAKCTGYGNGGGGCGAELLVEQPDLFRTFTHCRDATEEHVTFACGACGVPTDLAERAWPPHSVVQALPKGRPS